MYSKEQKVKPTLPKAEAQKTVIRLLKKPDGARILYESYDVHQAVTYVLRAVDDGLTVPAYAYLCRAAKNQSIRRKVNSYFDASERERLHKALKSEDSKLRKNAAKLTGVLLDKHDEAALIEAFLTEETYYVLPSMILSLGSFSREGSKAARQALENYKLPEFQEDQAKLASELAESLNKARSSYAEIKPHEFKGFTDAVDMELRCAPGLESAIIQCLNNIGIDDTACRRGAVRFKAADYVGIYQIRGFSEALLPIHFNDNELYFKKHDYRAMAERIGEYIPRILDAHIHQSGEAFSYRLEVRSSDDGRNRRTVIRELTNKISERAPMLHNSPGSYEFEIRLEDAPDENKGSALYIKLYTYKDGRFSYRIKDVPAAIAPSTAAALLESAREFMAYKPHARVLDVFAGSGTMLFERERISGVEPPRMLKGLDIAANAVDAARDNALAGHSKAQFVRTDCLVYRLGVSERYDEVISNLPFGNRVGGHKKNEILYKGIIERLPELLVSGGRALLYTTEKELMRRVIGDSKLELIAEIKVESGGMSPSAFVVRRV